MHTAAEQLSLPRPRNTELARFILEKCRVVSDLSEGQVGLSSSALYRWCTLGPTPAAYITVHRACQRMAEEGTLALIDGTNEWTPTERGRRLLAELSLQ
jgi:hypothetical protein